MDFKVGERCEIIGLKQRLDLNGKICTLVKWNRKFGRWIVSFDGNTGSCVGVEHFNTTIAPGQLFTVPGIDHHFDMLVDQIFVTNAVVSVKPLLVKHRA